MKKPVIICVDDEPIILFTLKSELNAILGDGYFIETAKSGSEALELFTQYVNKGHEVPIIISDYIMPEMNGDELLSKIHQLSPKTLKIILSGQSSPENFSNTWYDLYLFIQKPLDSKFFAANHQ